jgi:hypothetical protein
MQDWVCMAGGILQTVMTSTKVKKKVSRIQKVDIGQQPLLTTKVGKEVVNSRINENILQPRQGLQFAIYHTRCVNRFIKAKPRLVFVIDCVTIVSYFLRDLTRIKERGRHSSRGEAKLWSADGAQDTTA